MTPVAYSPFEFRVSALSNAANPEQVRIWVADQQYTRGYRTRTHILVVDKLTHVLGVRRVVDEIRKTGRHPDIFLLTRAYAALQLEVSVLRDHQLIKPPV